MIEKKSHRKLYDTKYDCCGCSACYATCPVKAIAMVPDDEGFVYPQINPTKCVDCGLCTQVCPLKTQLMDTMPLHLYAAKNKQDSIRMNSSSGGIFSLLAEYVESKNGVIYGAAFDKKYKVKHMRAESIEEWKEFCVSKYVQSDVNDVFLMVKNDLDNGKIVLFSGTPCQVDGLNQYLKKTKTYITNLITCDIVCHGVPSPKVWEDYLTYLSETYNNEIGFVSFRDKTEWGWHNSNLTIKGNEQNIFICENHKNNYYFQLFACHYILRMSCHSCQYANFHRPGDISLGDYWGIEKKYAQFDDNKGVSLVMVNSTKGEKIWREIKNGAEYFEVSKDQAVQPNLVAPSEENTTRDSFWHWYKKYGFKRVGQRMGYIPKSKVDEIIIFILRCYDKLYRLMNNSF